MTKTITTLLARLPRLPLEATDREVTMRALMLMNATGGMGGRVRDIRVLPSLPFMMPDEDAPQPTDEEIAAAGPVNPAHWLVRLRRIDGDTKGDAVTAEIISRPTDPSKDIQE